MSYTVLARKYRPSTFDEVIGQDHVCQALKNSLDNQKIHHAYLLSGTRGVGKTTLGRLFAKALNCDKGMSSKPCGECGPCTSLAAGSFLDLIEVDGASRTKVDETRELLDNVQYAPSIGRFKIYLIDEVHMLSTHSFNALLKTLEEPPAHVKFILATTNPSKLPVTVLSRCLQFNLKHINKEVVSKELQVICEKEGVTISPAACDLISLHAYGSMRDALSLLDQAIALGNGNVTDELTESMIGVTSRDKVIELVESIMNNNIHHAITLADEVVNLGNDLHALLQDIASTLQEMALMMVLDKASFTDSRDQKLFDLSKLSNPEEIQMLYQMALIGCRDMPICRTPDTSFKMAILRMIVFREDSEVTVAETTIAPTTPKEITEKKTTKAPVSITPAPVVMPEVAKPIMSINSENWGEKFKELKVSGALQEFIKHIELLEITDDHFRIVLDHASEHLMTKGITLRFNESLNEYLNREVDVEVSLSKVPLIDTASKKEVEELQEKIKKIEASFKEDSAFNLLEAEFDAKIESIELTPLEET